MTTPDSRISGGTPERASISALIEQLQASCLGKQKDQWRAYLCAALYGIIAALEGTQFFMLYCGMLVVVFLLQAFNEQCTRKQIDLMVLLVRELEKNGNGNTASQVV